MTRIYLDNAATSWPKPDSVYVAVDDYQRDLGVAAGRASYRAAEEVERTIARLRINIGRLIGGTSSNQIVFTQNCTDSLNLALHGLLRDGDHVVVSTAEHNSILRPLSELATRRNVTWNSVDVDQFGVVDIDRIADAMKETTRLIAMTHASNVTGAVQPIEAVGRLAKDRDCLFLVDAAQTLGHVPVDVVGQNIDLLAAPGHKGLLGPLGTGLLYISEGIEQGLCSLRQGGTGTQSELPEQPVAMPSKYESGNLNVPGLFGLDAGVRYVLENGLRDSDVLQSLCERFLRALEDVEGTAIYSQANPCGIASFNITSYDPREVAALLDSSAGIQVRAGLHCAPLMHRSLGTFDTGGTVRVSCGHFSTEAEIDKLIESVQMLAAEPMV